MPLMTIVGQEAIFDFASTAYPASNPMAGAMIITQHGVFTAGDDTDVYIDIPANAVLVGQGYEGDIVGNPQLSVKLDNDLHTVTVQSFLADAEPGNVYYFSIQIQP